MSRYGTPLRPSPWTLEVDARLKELVALGHKYERVAELLNAEFGIAVSKNACIGRGRRLEFAKRNTSPKPKTTAPVTVAIEPEPYRPFQQVFRDRPKPRDGEVGIEQLTPDICHWPHGEKPPYSYCGKATFQGGPYCRNHAEVSYPGITKRVA